MIPAIKAAAAANVFSLVFMSIPFFKVEREVTKRGTVLHPITVPRPLRTPV